MPPVRYSKYPYIILKNCEEEDDVLAESENSSSSSENFLHNNRCGSSSIEGSKRYDDEIVVDVECGSSGDILEREEVEGLQILRLWTWASSCLNLLLMGLCIFWWLRIRTLRAALPHWSGVVQTPLQQAIQYETVIFNDGWISNSSIYIAPPTHETDVAWRNLWEPFLVSGLPASQNPTHTSNFQIKISTSSSNKREQIRTLEIFHQLHCLDSLRQSLRPDRYSNVSVTTKGSESVDNIDGLEFESQIGLEYWDHCVEILRQGLMCTSDITPVTLTRDEVHGKNRWRKEDREHVCRDWEVVRKLGERKSYLSIEDRKEDV